VVENPHRTYFSARQWIQHPPEANFVEFQFEVKRRHAKQLCPGVACLSDCALINVAEAQGFRTEMNAPSSIMSRMPNAASASWSTGSTPNS